MDQHVLQYNFVENGFIPTFDAGTIMILVQMVASNATKDSLMHVSVCATKNTLMYITSYATRVNLVHIAICSTKASLVHKSLMRIAKCKVTVLGIVRHHMSGSKYFGTHGK